jgi:hypothetical protein
MSKPAIHTVTASQRSHAGGSIVPRTAIHAPAAAAPSVNPRIQCESQ